MSPIYDHIREAIAASEKSRYRIAKETGIGEPHLCQFMAGTKGLSVEAVEKLADCLALEIVTRRKKSIRDGVKQEAKSGRKEG